MRVLENYPVVTRGGSQHGYIDVIKVSGSTVKYKVDWDNGSTSWVNTTDVIVRDPNCISENDLCPVGYDLIGEEIRIVDSDETGIILDYINGQTESYEVGIHEELHYIGPELLIPIKYEQPYEDDKSSMNLKGIVNIVINKIRRDS